MKGEGTKDDQRFYFTSRLPFQKQEYFYIINIFELTFLRYIPVVLLLLDFCTMFRSTCYFSKHVERPILSLRPQVRFYTQQKTARTPRSLPQQTTVNPTPGSQVKNRTTVPSGSSSSVKPSSSHASQPALVVDEKLAAKVRRDVMARETKETGQEADMIRMSLKMGADPWAQKMSLLGKLQSQKCMAYVSDGPCRLANTNTSVKGTSDV